MSISDALNLKPERVTLQCGSVVLLRRPTLGDVIEALECNAKSPALANAHMLARHVLDESGGTIWADTSAALSMPARLAQELIPLIEALYREGQD
jgi:hypothetical protein